MDCEKFDRIVLDLLYDELDELTSAAAKRHMEHCARCRSIGSGLRATREVGVLPLVDPPAGLESRILEAERQATQLLPIGKRLGRGLSLLAGYAMRPQLAMAALLMLMIGSSLFFLRTQPGDRDASLNTERGVPESDNESVPLAPLATTPPEAARAAHAPAMSPSPTSRADDAIARRDRATDTKPEAKAAAPSVDLEAPAARGAGALGAPGASLDGQSATEEGANEPLADSDASYDAAMAAYRDGRYSEAERRFAAISARGGAHAANAALYEVQALRMVSGCPNAAPRFESVHSRYPGSVGSDAAWQAADCYRALGNLAAARRNYDELTADPSYKARAKEAIAELDQIVANAEVAARKAAAKPAAATASKPAAAAPAKPAQPRVEASPAP